jgi:hypothetical protein
MLELTYVLFPSSHPDARSSSAGLFVLSLHSPGHGELEARLRPD